MSYIIEMPEMNDPEEHWYDRFISSFLDLHYDKNESFSGQWQTYMEFYKMKFIIDDLNNARPQIEFETEEDAILVKLKFGI